VRREKVVKNAMDRSQRLQKHDGMPQCRTGTGNVNLCVNTKKMCRVNLFRGRVPNV